MVSAVSRAARRVAPKSARRGPFEYSFRGTWRTRRPPIGGFLEQLATRCRRTSSRKCAGTSRAPAGRRPRGDGTLERSRVRRAAVSRALPTLAEGRRAVLDAVMSPVLARRRRLGGRALNATSCRIRICISSPWSAPREGSEVEGESEALTEDGPGECLLPLSQRGADTPACRRSLVRTAGCAPEALSRSLASRRCPCAGAPGGRRFLPPGCGRVRQPWRERPPSGALRAPRPPAGVVHATAAACS